MLTADRLYQTTFLFHYRTTWSTVKTKITILISYVLIVSFQLYVHLGTDRLTRFHIRLYSGVILAVIFQLFSIFTYVVMFIVFIKSRRRAQPSQRVSIWRSFVRSNFALSVYLIASFILLVVVPYIIWSYITVKDEEDFYKILTMLYYRYDKSMVVPRAGSEGFQPVFLYVFYYFQISVAVSSRVDAFLYFFMQKNTRKLFMKKFCCCCRRRRRNPQAEELEMKVLNQQQQ